jgi:ankyrin repeat protein
VQSGANINLIDSLNETPLAIATSKGFSDIVDFLKQSGAIQ